VFHLSLHCKLKSFFFVSLSSLLIFRVAQLSRLILNLLEANCPLDESIDSSTMESLRFCHTESTGDTEADISRGDGGAASLNEEIHEEER